MCGICIILTNYYAYFALKIKYFKILIMKLELQKFDITRIKNELFLSAEKVRGIKIHGTPISLKKYCLIFIYFSPFLYNSQSFVSSSSSNIENFMPLFFVLVVSFVLMALYNIQDYIENPFDQEGLDDLKIDNLKVGKVEGLFD